MKECKFVEMCEDLVYGKNFIPGKECDSGCFFVGVEIGYCHPNAETLDCCDRFDKGRELGLRLQSKDLSRESPYT